MIYNGEKQYIILKALCNNVSSLKNEKMKRMALQAINTYDKEKES